MANVFVPNGFNQYRGTGSSPTYEQVPGQIAASTAAIFFGDPVFRLATGATGTLAGATTGPGPGTTPIAGIFIGCKYLSVAQKRTVWSNYWPGSDVATGQFAEGYFINDPNAQFIAQVGVSTTTGVTALQVGLNVQFAYGTGNTFNGISGAYVDISVTPAVTATLPFRVVGLLTDPPGANGTIGNGAANNSVILAFNNVETKNTLAV